ncbi:2-methylene-furan-3-one reductase [Colletotrichum gloeosporioides]|uniref:2-methylene-furan-3-one reductase n=1 Tax=Colletotrichum gloeosporioides TaxID=474922 RepID=A0A8H4CMY0_COLGL|nr:2-methylene-furan-3-one reductase [Colletotrichum gloeosporioides]KAF3806860.1 2-methylene-furan-3-one reductase [Colletotrichum gloeosporioides]
MASSMLAITAPSYTDPSGYQLSTLPQPIISDPTEVLFRVHAASINPVDVKKAAGIFKLAVKESFPYQIGYDCAGVVTQVGKDVKGIKVGDEVFSRLPEASRGAWSEYAKCPERFVALKPKNLSFENAASLPLAGMTALQTLSRYQGSLAGKTVFVPAGLSGTGAYACQLAKKVFNAGKVITTVSTSKVEQVLKLLGEGTVDQVIDHTKDDPKKVIPRASVDFILDTTGEAMSFLHLMVPSTSMIVSIATQPSGTQLQQSSVMKRPDNPRLPWFGRLFLDIFDTYRRTRARRWGVAYEYLFLDPNAKDLETLARYAEEGNITPVVGCTVNLKDVDEVKAACGTVYNGKGGVGKTVIRIG